MIMQEVKQSVSWDSLSYKLETWIFEALISLGFTSMTPVQASTIPLLSEHKDVVVEAVTGSGKTLAFVIPVLEKICKAIKEGGISRGHFGAIIISPTRELANQIHNVFESVLNFQPEDQPQIKTQLLVGSVQSVREDLHHFITVKPQILVGTPGRILDFLSNNAVKTNQCEIVILDEADKLLDISFLTNIQSIVRLLPRQRRTGLFSATISSAGSDVFKTGMTNPVKVTVKSNSLSKSSVPTSLGLFYMVVKPELKLKSLLELLVSYRYRKVIVYFPTCFGVTHFYGMFNNLIKNSKNIEDKEDIKVFSLHGKLEAKPRLNTLNKFSISRIQKSILFTTDVAARGLDIPDVDFVIQIDPPTDPDVFLHRCGRTGRANKVGKAITMISEGREEDYINFMEIKGIELKELDPPNIDNKFSDWFDTTLRNWLLEDRARYDHAIRSYVSFMRYYSMHIASSIFRVQELDYLGLAKMYGLVRFPKMPENKYVKDFPEDGWIDKSVDFDKYSYMDKVKETTRLEELKTEKRKMERKEKSLKRKELKSKNSSWSRKTDGKENKVERQEKMKRRREAVEAELKNGGSSDGEDFEAVIDWKDVVRASKKQKKNQSAIQGSFDDL